MKDSRLHRIILTGKQKEAYRWIVDEVSRTGEWPSFREIQAGLGYKSANSVTQLVKALTKKGWLIKRLDRYDFVDEDMPYLTPQLKKLIGSVLMKMLEKASTKEEVEEAIRKALSVSLNELPPTET